MIIGVPKEIKNNENRVGMTPAGVAELVKKGHTVYVQATAGANSGFSDDDYIAVGAKTLPTIEDTYAAADMIVKVKEPITPEYKLIKKGQVVFTYFHFAADKLLTEAMIESGAVCIAYETEEKEDCNVPWAILLDPTSACNLHCTGCWAAEYGHKLNLSLETIDDIVTQGKKLGTYMYIYTGGEPMVRKKDIITICERHPDCEFLSFTNGTLIDEEFCQEMLRVKNFVPAISLEGFETANDGRRGPGVFDKVKHAMQLLKEHNLPFGISTCYTSMNYKDITSEEFYDMIIEAGALFIWFFHYMPVGNDAAPELMPNPEQRKAVYERIRAFRSSKPIFSLDFQNDAEYIGGCIAGGRNYCHINPKGDVEPCVFIHYSGANIREKSLLECLKQPLFMAYRDGQPFNDNMLRPCPMLENPELLQKMVHETGAHSTDVEEAEPVEHLCGKCEAYACEWKKTADKLWEEHPYHQKGYTNFKKK